MKSKAGDRDSERSAASGRDVVVILTRFQYEVLLKETGTASCSADDDDGVAFWKSLQAGLSPSRWRLSAELAASAVTYCDGICAVTEDDGVRRAFAAVRRKLARAESERATPSAVPAKKLTEDEWRRVFSLRCQSKRGQGLSDADRDFCHRAFQSDPDRYKAMGAKVFEETASFGSVIRGGW